MIASNVKSIDPDTMVGTVALTVGDFDLSLPYYQHNLGLKLHKLQGDTAYLGVGGHDLLLLTERPSAPQARGTTGLYHFALLVPSRLELARTLSHLIDTQTPIGGASDHLVSEALYLSDPDGNGIEIYRDRPRDEWVRQNGSLQMGTQPLDFNGVMAELVGHQAPWKGLHSETRMGHIHLHVNHLDSAETFYTQALGFDFMARYGPSAVFVSAGGYHHHIGMNTWAGVNAPPPPEGAIGLNWYTILLPHQAAFQETTLRLKSNGIQFEERENGVFLRDPAQNGIYLKVRQ